MKRKIVCIITAIAAVFCCLVGCGEKEFERRVLTPELESGEIIKVVYGTPTYGSSDADDNAFLTIEGRLRVEQVSETDYEVYILTGTNFNLSGSTEFIYNIVYIHTNPGDFLCIMAPYISEELNTNAYYFKISKAWYIG